MYNTVQEALRGRADYYDIRALDVTGTQIELKGNEVSKAMSGSESGACVRVLFNGAWGFASTPDQDEASVKEAADKAARMSKGISERIKEKTCLAPVKPATDEVTVGMKKTFLTYPWIPR